MTHVTRADADLRDQRVADCAVAPDDDVVAALLNELEPRVLPEGQPVVRLRSDDEQRDPMLIELIFDGSGVGIDEARYAAAHQRDLGVLEIRKNDVEVEALPEPVLGRPR